MLLPRLGALLFAASYAHALKNASPFFLLSSDPLPSDAPLQSSQIALSSDVVENLIATLSACDRKWYYIFYQDSVTASDVQEGMSKVRERIMAADKSQVVEIPEVVDWRLDGHGVFDRLVEMCEAKGKKRSEGVCPELQDDQYQVAIMTPKAPPSTGVQERFAALDETDTSMNHTVSAVLDGKISTVLIYISTPPIRRFDNEDDGDVYEMDEPYPEALHTDLKRDTKLRRRQSDDDDMQAGLPLFEKYQFLSPPLFMGLSVSILLLLILSVGVRAISGLEVSYAAFNKEMGPQAQKPKQQ